MLDRRIFAAVLVAAVLGPNAAVQAQDWPQRPVRFIYPFAAGSAGDSAARIISQRLSEVFKQQFIIENRVGASGTLAAEAVAHAPPDGYTLFWATSPQISITPALQKVPYDPVKDFIPISAALTNSTVLVVNQKVPVKSVAEYIAWVKAQPEKLAYAQSGAGSIIHLAMEMFLARAGLKMTPVGYKGNALAMTDVVAGHVPTMFSLLGDALEQAKGGTIRMLAVTELATLAAGARHSNGQRIRLPRLQCHRLERTPRAGRHAQGDRRSPVGGDRPCGQGSADRGAPDRSRRRAARQQARGIGHHDRRPRYRCGPKPCPLPASSRRLPLHMVTCAVANGFVRLAGRALPASASRPPSGILADVRATFIRSRTRRVAGMIGRVGSVWLLPQRPWLRGFGALRRRTSMRRLG